MSDLNAIPVLRSNGIDKLHAGTLFQFLVNKWPPAMDSIQNANGFR